MKTAVVRVVASMLFHSGMVNALQTRTGRNLREKTPQELQSFPFGVLLYHRVNPDADPYFPSVSTDVFDAQMDYLARHYRVLSLGEILDRIENGLQIEPYTIAITFDDGYRDNYLYAFPILQKYGLPATIFVATGYVGTDRMMWNDQVAWAVKKTKTLGYRLEIHNQCFDFSFRSSVERIKSLNEMLEHLKPLSDSEKLRIVSCIVRNLGKDEKKPGVIMLNWSELRKIAQDGWEIGSHTVNHTILTKVSGEEAQKELSFSKETLEAQLQRPVTLFAYPNGKRSDFDTGIKDIAREVGYRAAVTTLHGFNKGSLDPFEVRRHSVWEGHLPSFAVKLQLYYSRALKGRYLVE